MQKMSYGARGDSQLRKEGEKANPASVELSARAGGRQNAAGAVPSAGVMP